jgi:hypothetical protein
MNDDPAPWAPDDADLKILRELEAAEAREAELTARGLIPPTPSDLLRRMGLNASPAAEEGPED